MAGLQEDWRSHSTLEWLGSDGTVGVPQALGPAITVGFDNTLELDGSRSAPEVRLGTSPEVFYSTQPPEAIDTVEKSQDLVPANAKARSWAKWVLAILGLMVVAALAIGLKVGLQNRNSPRTPPKPVNSSLTQQIIDDSSLAATLAANGDRYLFFQAPQGAIRRMIYTATEAQWIADPDPITIPDAKMLTPMAISTPSENQLGFHYITTSNQLNSSLFDGQDWIPGQNPSFNGTTAPDTRQLSVMSNTPTSNTPQIMPSNGTVNLGLLLYEDAGGNVAALLQVQQDCNLTSDDCSSYGTPYWHDVTILNQSKQDPYFLPVEYNSSFDTYYDTLVSSTLYESRPGAKFSPPFATGASLYVNGSETGISVDLLICDDGTQTSSFSSDSPSFECDNVGYTTYRSWTNASYGFFEAQKDTAPDYDEDDGVSERDAYDKDAYSYQNIEESDLAIIDYGYVSFAVWINGTKPSLLGYKDISDENFGPNVSFPFTRLASIASPEQNTSYLYHQIDGTTLAEEHYDDSLRRWLSTNITVPNAFQT